MTVYVGKANGHGEMYKWSFDSKIPIRYPEMDVQKHGKNAAIGALNCLKSTSDKKSNKNPFLGSQPF